MNRHKEKVAIIHLLKILLLSLSLITTVATCSNIETVTAKTHVASKHKHKHKQHKVHKVRKNRKIKSPIIDPLIKARAITNFTTNDLANYHLLGTRWNTKTVSYNETALNSSEQACVDDAVQQINNLHIVHLTQTNRDANITLKASLDSNDALGITKYRFNSNNTYKGLSLLNEATITFYTNNINQFDNAQLEFNDVILHEIGHALGLAHNNTFGTVMSTHAYPPDINTYDQKHTIIDQYYINALEVLYNN